MNETAFIALGSNLGEREQHLQAALERLNQHPAIEVLVVSPLYETAPVGDTEQGWFLNAVAQLSTSLTPSELLQACLEIEQTLGRVRDPQRRNGPRVIDLDVLSHENAVLSEPTLTLPHPRLHERAFVLIPLAALAPDWQHPVLHCSAQQLAEALPASQTQMVFRYSSAALLPS